MTFESLSKLRNGAPEQDNTSSWIVQKFGGFFLWRNRITSKADMI